MATSDDPVSPAEGTYAQKYNPCGCRSVPEGQHLPGCRHYGEVKEAVECPHCGFRTKLEAGVCGACNAQLETPE